MDVTSFGGTYRQGPPEATASQMVGVPGQPNSAAVINYLNPHRRVLAPQHSSAAAQSILDWTTSRQQT